MNARITGILVPYDTQAAAVLIILAIVFRFKKVRHNPSRERPLAGPETNAGAVRELYPIVIMAALWVNCRGLALSLNTISVLRYVR